MDRDNRMERTQCAINALTSGSGCDTFENFSQLESQVQNKYSSKETDEFFKPLVKSNSPRIKANDNILFFNFRSDRMRQIVKGLSETSEANIYCMTRYSEEFNFPTLSPPQSLSNILAQVVSKENLKQCHIAGNNYILNFRNGEIRTCDLFL
jgi:2,3-bisphosphoglycerate-independent phosphoglycerate mutase